VLVMDRGQIVEEGSPEDLARRHPSSRFNGMLAQATKVRKLFTDDTVWDRLVMNDGVVTPRAGAAQP
jgi:hypothetical protein